MSASTLFSSSDSSAYLPLFKSASYGLKSYKCPLPSYLQNTLYGQRCSATFQYETKTAKSRCKHETLHSQTKRIYITTAVSWLHLLCKPLQLLISLGNFRNNAADITYECYKKVCKYSYNFLLIVLATSLPSIFT